MQWTLITTNTVTGSAIHECPACYGQVEAGDLPGVTLDTMTEEARIGDHGCDRCDNANRPSDEVAAAQYALITEPHPESVFYGTN